MNTCSLRLIVLAAATLTCGSAAPIVSIKAEGFSSLGHVYTLTVKSDDKAIQGVIIVNGFTLFGLGPGSPIEAPPDWSFIPPFGPSADQLIYSSNKMTADIKAGRHIARRVRVRE